MSPTIRRPVRSPTFPTSLISVCGRSNGLSDRRSMTSSVSESSQRTGRSDGLVWANSGDRMSTPMRLSANVSAGIGESSLASSSSKPAERRPRLRPPHPAKSSMKVCMTVQYREETEKSPGGC